MAVAASLSCRSGGAGRGAGRLRRMTRRLGHNAAMGGALYRSRNRGRQRECHRRRGLRHVRCRGEGAEIAVPSVVLVLLFDWLAVRTGDELCRPVHGADGNRRTRSLRAGHPTRGHQRAQQHRGKRDVDGGKTEIAFHEASCRQISAQSAKKSNDNISHLNGMP